MTSDDAQNFRVNVFASEGAFRSFAIGDNPGDNLSQDALGFWKRVGVGPPAEPRRLTFSSSLGS